MYISNWPFQHVRVLGVVYITGLIQVEMMLCMAYLKDPSAYKRRVLLSEFIHLHVEYMFIIVRSMQAYIHTSNTAHICIVACIMNA